MSKNIPTKWASLADRLNPSRSAFDPAFKEAWKAMPKSERKKIIAQDKKDIAALKKRGTTNLPFAAEPGDHCETSPLAYRHIVPVLNLIAKAIGKEPSSLQIYDPYYCAGMLSNVYFLVLFPSSFIRTCHNVMYAGAMVSHLNKLGFNNVYNKPEDFYQVIQDGDVPEYDVLVTNPPYSSGHFDKLLDYIAENDKPVLLLLPEHLSKNSSIYSEEQFCFLSPPERYHYWTPAGMRTEQEHNSKKKKQHMNLILGRRNSPFNSYWYISMEPIMTNDQFMSCANRGEVELTEGCKLYKHQIDVEQISFKGEEIASAEDEEKLQQGKHCKKRKKVNTEKQ